MVTHLFFFRLHTGGVGWLSSPAEASEFISIFLFGSFLVIKSLTCIQGLMGLIDEKLYWSLVQRWQLLNMLKTQLGASQQHQHIEAELLRGLKWWSKTKLKNAVQYDDVDSYVYIRVPMISFRSNVLLRTSACRWAETLSPSAALHISAEVLSLSPSAGPHPPAEPEKHTKFHLSNYYHVTVTFTFYN